MEKKENNLSQFLYDLWVSYLYFKGLGKDKHKPKVWGDLLVYMWQNSQEKLSAVGFIEKFSTWLHGKQENKDAMEKLYKAMCEQRKKQS